MKSDDLLAAVNLVEFCFGAVDIGIFKISCLLTLTSTHVFRCLLAIVAGSVAWRSLRHDHNRTVRAGIQLHRIEDPRLEIGKIKTTVFYFNFSINKRNWYLFNFIYSLSIWKAQKRICYACAMICCDVYPAP